MGTGTLDMIRRCSDANLSEPEFTDSSGFKTTIWRATPPEQIKVPPASLPGDLKSRVLNLLTEGPLSRSELSKQLGQKEVSGQLKKVFRDLLTDRMIEYTLPEKLRSPRQQYRLTNKGRTELAQSEVREDRIKVQPKCSPSAAQVQSKCSIRCSQSRYTPVASQRLSRATEN